MCLLLQWGSANAGLFTNEKQYVIVCSAWNIGVRSGSEVPNVGFESGDGLLTFIGEIVLFLLGTWILLGISFPCLYRSAGEKIGRCSSVGEYRTLQSQPKSCAVKFVRL